MKKNMVAFMLTTCCLCMGIPFQAQAVDLPVYYTTGPDYDLNGYMEEFNVDTETLKWETNNKFSVTLKGMRKDTGEVIETIKCLFRRPSDTGIWLISIPEGHRMQCHNIPAYTFPLAKVVLDTCYYEKASVGNYVPNKSDAVFIELEKRLAEMTGTWTTDDGYTIDIKGMTLNGYQILEAYDLIGKTPGNVTIVIRQPNGCRVAELNWLSGTTDGGIPYFVIDNLYYENRK